ncbi:Next to BRCA1, central domain,Immunoglobulin-like fold [Cinara cedri]|uniref:Next to BRCA1, central domain,Immunoglobulin-like fold n=1 Tax=Cinara cedri TaxID=506608 RepID=A0A5E4MVI5_9HEMI|nr:Next to BRCA1, central domain,Immunoglobulin-like fold [Cinara cedri]
MDVDNDPLDQNLLRQFNCLCTTDKENLVKGLRELIGEQLTESDAVFFLEMNDWNMHRAVGTYFDINSDHTVIPSMSLVRDENSENVLQLPPNLRFTKCWEVKNNGPFPWPPGCTLQFNGGDFISVYTSLPTTTLGPGCTMTLSTDLVTPSKPGSYQSKWRMMTPSGSYFGDIIWTLIQVEVNDSDSFQNDLSRQLDESINLGSSTPQTQPNALNPFSTPQQNQGLNQDTDESQTNMESDIL